MYMPKPVEKLIRQYTGIQQSQSEDFGVCCSLLFSPRCNEGGCVLEVVCQAPRSRAKEHETFADAGFLALGLLSTCHRSTDQGRHHPSQIRCNLQRLECQFFGG